jgi:hypothetical protein
MKELDDINIKIGQMIYHFTHPKVTLPYVREAYLIHAILVSFEKATSQPKETRLI